MSDVDLFQMMRMQFQGPRALKIGSAMEVDPELQAYAQAARFPLHRLKTFTDLCRAWSMIDQDQEFIGIERVRSKRGRSHLANLWRIECVPQREREAAAMAEMPLTQMPVSCAVLEENRHGNRSPRLITALIKGSMRDEIDVAIPFSEIPNSPASLSRNRRYAIGVLAHRHWSP